MCGENWTASYSNDLTSFGTVGIRIPHKGEVQMDPTHFFFMATSNGMESTADLANRCCIIRLRKQQQDYKFRRWDGKDLLEHVREKHDYYLGCVFSIIKDGLGVDFHKVRSSGTTSEHGQKNLMHIKYLIPTPATIYGWTQDGTGTNFQSSLVVAPECMFHS